MSSIGVGGSVVVVWIGLAIFPCLPAAGEVGEDVQLKESELSRLQGDIVRLQDDLQSKERQQQALVEELRSAEQAIGRSVQRLRSFTEDLRQQESRLNALTGERDMQQDALQIERSALALQLRAAYAMGRQQRLKIVLNQQDPAVISRMMVYYDYLNRARAERMARISQVIEELKLDKIKVYSDKELIYSFYPFFNLKNLSEVNSIEPGGSKEYTFGVESGLKVDDRLMTDNLIDIEMKFISDLKFYQLNLNDIVVEQAY